MGSRAIIVAAGDVDHGSLRAAVTPTTPGGHPSPPPLVIGADGGALLAERVGLTIDLVLGDGDSLVTADLERLRAAGTEVRLVAPEKEESDTELCLREAIARGASEIEIFGALGGSRPEHTLANVALLCLPELAGVRVTLVQATSRIRLIGDRAGPTTTDLVGASGDFISLQPIGDGVEGVTTDQLRYPLRDEALPCGPSRGLSNELLGERGRVSVRRGRLLITHTARGEL